MTVLSKLFNETQLDTSHHLTQKRHLFLGSSMLSLAIWVTSLVLNYHKAQRVVKQDAVASAYLQKSKKPKPETFRSTLTRLVALLKITVGYTGAIHAIAIAAALLMRTVCDLWLISNLSQCESAIIAADFKKLKLNLMEFMFASPILALVNNGLKYCISQLQLNLRYKITSYMTNKYMTGLTYYHINAVDNRLQNVDQLLTNDIEKFCSTLVDVYSNMAKPFFDIVVYIQRLSVTYTGLTTPAAMIGYLMFAGGILTTTRRPLTRMHAEESQLEGELRFVHSRLIANAEEIAFYQGNKRENITLASSLDRLRDHSSKMHNFHFSIDYLDNIVTRYLAQVCGYLALSIPFMSSRYAQDNHTTRLETYYKSGRMMLAMSQSIGRLISASRDWNRLAAYTHRVSNLLEYIEEDRNLLRKNVPPIQLASGRTLLPHSGQLQYCDPNYPMIEMVNVPLCTPNGDLLVDGLNLKVVIGQNVIITGPNGSGKSSLFRLLGELWPLFGGKLVKPHNDKLFYIPQKPYMALGTFRDQIIYPDTYEDMQRKELTDNDLLDILNIVQLDYLLEREPFDSVQDWAEVLSGGEKQRIALARLIYFKPQFAILDECTSAVSADVEQAIYQYLVDAKFCSLLSVTHRVRQLERFHDYVLEFNGLGSCEFKLIIDDC